MNKENTSRFPNIPLTFPSGFVTAFQEIYTPDLVQPSLLLKAALGLAGQSDPLAEPSIARAVWGGGGLMHCWS